MVKSLLLVYDASTQFLIHLKNSFWYYSQHPICIPRSISSSKSNMIFSKYVLSFLFNHSSKYRYYYLSCVCVETDGEIVAFCSFWFLLEGIFATSMKSLGHSPFLLCWWSVVSVVWNCFLPTVWAHAKIHHYFLQLSYSSSPWQLFPLHCARCKDLSCLHLLPLQVRLLHVLVN